MCWRTSFSCLSCASLFPLDPLEDAELGMERGGLGGLSHASLGQAPVGPGLVETLRGDRQL
eukprot:5389813-Pyramimonas_sp.AAC.1